MRYVLPFSLLAVAAAFSVSAQEPIYRCDNNEYTNVASDAKARGCKLLEGGNVTVVQSARRVQQQASDGASRAATASAPVRPRVDSAEQSARDGEARAILESELKKAETRRDELLKEYNGGEPAKQGGEARNYQKYLDRVAELKASIARNDSDIEGLKRELGRLSPAASK